MSEENEILEEEILEEDLEEDKKLEKARSNRKKFWLSLLPYMIALVVGLLISIAINTKFPIVLVNGSSMNPTFKNGNIMFCSTDTSNIKRGDVLIFRESGERLVKRVIGLPGEKVSIKDGQVYINGTRLNEYEFEPMEYEGCLENGTILRLQEGQYFCLGDNRNNSRDSRYFGPVNSSKIEFVFVKKLF